MGYYSLHKTSRGPLLPCCRRCLQKSSDVRQPCIVMRPRSTTRPRPRSEGAGQIRNLFQFAMLFEKSKEKSKIRTWYHKSFLSTSRLSEGGGREGPHRPGHGKKILYGKSMGKWTVGTHGSMLKVKGLSLQRGLPITFLHKFLPVVMAFFQDSTFACLALFPPGQSRPRRMYGNLLSCILVKRHSFSPYV